MEIAIQLHSVADNEQIGAESWKKWKVEIEKVTSVFSRICEFLRRKIFYSPRNLLFTFLKLYFYYFTHRNCYR